MIFQYLVPKSDIIDLLILYELALCCIMKLFKCDFQYFIIYIFSRQELDDGLHQNCTKESESIPLQKNVFSVVIIGVGLRTWRRLSFPV